MKKICWTKIVPKCVFLYLSTLPIQHVSAQDILGSECDHSRFVCEASRTMTMEDQTSAHGCRTKQSKNLRLIYCIVKYCLPPFTAISSGLRYISAVSFEVPSLWSICRPKESPASYLYRRILLLHPIGLSLSICAGKKGK